MAYYGLFHLEEGQWVFDFGDTDKSCVLFERDEVLCNPHGTYPVRKKDTRLFCFNRTTTAKQLIQHLYEMNNLTNA